MSNNFSVVILAAGKGKRMKSKLPKVLHKVKDISIIQRTVETAKSLNPKKTIVVVSDTGKPLLKKELGSYPIFKIQKSQLGTADAAKTALSELKDEEHVAIMYGDDTAFYKHKTLQDVINLHIKSKSKVTFITLLKDNPSGLGRIIRKKGKVAAIIEEKDATVKQKEIKEINDGFYVFEKKWLRENIKKVRKSQITGEYYLTDLIIIALSQGEKVETFKLKDSNQWHGINTPEELDKANLRKIKKIHIMGIAGAGASAVAGIAKAYGFQVSGCDLNPKTPYAKNLKTKILNGHAPFHIKKIDLLILSPAVLKLDPQNSEIKKAKKLNMPIMTWQEFQGKFLQKDKFVLAVSGAYGKSTTTAMISQILIDSGLDPTCELGANVISWKSNYKVGKSKFYVCESDEYNNNFLNYKPDIAVILNTDWDHPDFFKSKHDLLNSYKNFIKNINNDGLLIIENTKELNSIAKFAPKSVKVININKFSDFNLSIIGDFRIQNANAALTVAKVLKLDINKAKKTIENFQGLERRLEYKGKIKNVTVYDDYAVQPITIKKTTNALAKKFKNKKLSLVLEPHTFSRVETFFNDFVTSLKNTDAYEILITEIYSARERGDRRLLSKKLAREVGEKAKFTGSIEDTATYIKKNISEFEIILSMGAGKSHLLFEHLSI